MKRIYIALIGLLLCAGGYAQTSGTCGDNLTWTLTGTENDLTLTISGTGNMDNYRGNQVPWRAQRKNIKTLVLPDGMTSIGNWAFGQLSITSITIPNSVKVIGEGAFSFCSGLTSVTIPNSVTTIGKDAFAMSGLTSITIPNSVTEIGNNSGIMSGITTDIYVSWTTLPPKTLRAFDLLRANQKINLHIPQGAMDTYRSLRIMNVFNLVEDVDKEEEIITGRPLTTPATIKVIRIKSMLGAVVPYSVQINNEHVGNINNGDTLEVPVLTSHNVVIVSDGLGPFEGNFTVDLEEGGYAEVYVKARKFVEK